jgi:osmotically-inducible protein OsmY
MRVWRVVPLVMVVAAAVLCGGCAAQTPDKPAQAEPAPAMRAAGQPVTSSTLSGNEPGDESIGSEIRRLLDTEPAATAGIIVQVDDGKVTLRGSAPTRAAAWKAEGGAHSVKGVKSVANQIVVNTPSTSPVVPPAAGP